ncbi:hypothetical protein OSB04_023662 [Centaurea solstitialis]|uniref:Integrase catalytic domain-containing protein n=1 Tax=Centaurea solstitialis TaxID=347529 RepID=A0AA38SX20_9ASTR|nr:hypothetical protein OSB04_023662 [Centaurea solstitialis]
MVQKRKNQPKKKVNVQKKKVEKKTVKMVTKWVPKASLSNTTASTSSGNESVDSESSGNNQKDIEVNTAASNSSSGISNTVATTSSSLRQPIVTKYSSHEIPNTNYLMKLNRLTEGNPDRNENLWHVDSGCSRHMTGNRSFLEDFTRFNGGYVAFGDNPKGGKVSGKGKVTGGKLTLEDVYYVDQLRYNLMSVSQVCDKKFFTLFSETECMILSPKFVVDESLILLRTPRKDNVYCLDLNGMPSEVVNCLFSKASMTESSLWHRRMGHMNIKTMNLLVKNQLVRGLPSKEFTLDDNCVACLKGKPHKASHKSKTINTISAPLQLLHMDLFGPTNVMSIGKKSYCLVIIDDYSRFTWVFFLRTKDETSGLIKPFVKRVENQLNLRVKVIRSDNGTEFKNADLNSFCEEKGIERQFSAPRTPQQNGVAERRNRTLIEAARTMLADSKLPINFWAEAVNTACYVQNRVHVVKSKGKTPYELFKNKKPFIGFFVPFGCPCSILNTKTHLGKFDSKADDGFFVGYSIQSKAVRVFNTVSRTIEESDNVKFNEHTPNVHGTGPDWLFDIDSLTNSLNMSNAVDTVQKRKNQRLKYKRMLQSTKKEIKRLKETPQLESNVENESVDTSEITQPDPSKSDPDDSNLGDILSEEPLHLTRTQKNHPASQVIGDVASPMITRKQSREAGYVNTHSGMLSCFLYQNEPKKVSDAMKDPSWIEAMQEELLQFVLQHVWDLVDLPKGHRVIGTKWIFRNKTDERGIVIKNKARLVAQGYTQKEGIDYDDVFAPVARIEAIRLFLAFASYKGFRVYQMDVKSAFLYGTIDEEVYVCQPPGFEDPKYPDRIYVDDIIFGSTKADMCKEFEELMHKKFKMSSMGELTFFLGLQVKKKSDGIFINQSKYVATMLQKFGMHDAKPASTPMETHKHLTADVEGEEVDVHQYRSMIGSLMYLTASRPDIMFAVCVCARFQVRPKESHLHAVKRIFKYLKGQPRLGLWYPNDTSFDLVAYTDSDYGGANLDRKSTSGGCQFLGGRLVSWQCKKQTTVSQSTTEAEYIAASQCCSQVLWIQNQMQDYGLSFLQTPIYIDNNSAISIVNNPVKHSKTKHIEIKYHLIRDCNEKKLIQVLKVHTDDQYADLFTKAFDVGKVYCIESIMESMCFIKDHNKVGYFKKDVHSEGFEDILEFLASSHIAYAATINPTIYIQHQHDFWLNAVIQEEQGVKAIQTTICGHSLTLTPEKIRLHLQFHDERGISMLSTKTLMENLLRMGYTGSKTSLKYLKGKLCPQWRFFVHTLLHCFSKKTTGFGEFSSTMASALVCLATNQVFNFSQMIFDDLVYNLENIHNSKVKTFYMFPRFVQEVITRELTAVPMTGDIYKSSALGHKSEPPQGEASGLQPTQPSIPSDDLPTPITTTIPQSLEKTPTPILKKYQRKNRGAPSSSGSKPQKPLSQQLEHSPSVSTQRDTPGVQPHSSIKKVPSKEKDGHVVGEAQTTDVAQGVHQDSLNISKTPTTATPSEKSQGGPRCQETKGASSASARLKTKVKKLKDPVMEVNTPKPGEGISQKELMDSFTTIAKDLKAFERNFFVHDEKHGSHEERLDTLEELATAQHDLLKLHEAQLVKQAKVIQAQGATIASMKGTIRALRRRYNTLVAFTKGERRSEFKGEPEKDKEVVNEPIHDDNDEVPDDVIETGAGAEGEPENEARKEETKVANELLVNAGIKAESQVEVNEDDLTIAQLLVKMPEIEDFEEARMLVEDLKMMFAFSKTKAELKKNRKRDQNDSIGEGKVISWNTYESRVFSVNFEKGRMSFFLMDKRYDFEPIMMGSMLEVKKKAENLSELDKELIGRLREQLLELNENYFDEEVIELKQKKITGWGVDQNLRYVVKLDDGSELCDSEWENILEECTRENLKEMYDQRCTVIKEAVNDRDNPDQAKKRKFALECLFWLFEPFKLLGVKNSNCEDVKEWRWFEKCKVYSLRINDGEMEYYFEECETDALDIQRLQYMMKVNLSTSVEPTRAARLLVKKTKTYLKIRLSNLAPHVEKSCHIEDQTYLWHCRLGHINKKRVELLLKGGFLGSFDYKPFDNCESCLSGKMTKQHFNKENERATDLLEIIHTDVCGPFSYVARGGYRYFITFTDDFSRYGYVYLMRHKSKSFERFKEFQNEVQNQLGRKIKFLRSDRGGEYLSDEFDNHLMECGIVSQLTPPYTPQMNGVSERRNRTLLDMPKSDKCFFVGYPRTTMGYYFYNSKENKVFVARNGKFLEEKFLSSGNTRKDVDLQVVDEENTTPIVEPEIQHENVEPQSEPIEEVQTHDLRRSSRVRQEPDRYLGFLVSQDSGDLNEPTSYGEAVLGNESEQWQEAMKAEMQSMYDNQVWELTDLPQHCRAVGRKWVFKKKTEMDGNVHTFKARLVAKGFTQTHGIDYDETFSPVAMLKSIRILMAISAYFNYEIWHMDVKTAFLNEKLTEDVYMEQPEGFEDPKNPNKRIKEFGFAKSEFEPCVYTKFSGSIVTFLVLYVDEILLIGNDVPTLQSVKSWLSRCFQMKDLGEAAYILGIKIYRNRSKRLIGLSQSTYIDKILKKFRMDESKKGFIPMKHGIVLSKTQCPVSSQDHDKMKSVPYASAIGSIMYAMLCTRPDVAYSVSVTSRYQQNPGEPHWVAVKNILKYLRRTKDMFLVFAGSEDEISVTGYSDASFQTDRDDFRSQSGYVFTLNGGAISWKSSKQDTIADSTTEAEYIAASDAAKEAVWLRNFLSDLRVVASVSRPIDIFCDNSGAVAQAKEPREHHKSRHVLRKYHLIREIIGRGDVRICKIPTEENVADPLTKPLARVKHEAHANSIGMQYLDVSS